MKTAVTGSTADQLVLSTAMEDLQDYYDTPVLPARPHAPKDKATVERAVQIIEKESIATSAQIVFESFGDSNKVYRLFQANSTVGLKSLRNNRETKCSMQ